MGFSTGAMGFHHAKTLAVEAFEKGYLRELLVRHGGNVSSAAREAGVDRRTIHRMLKRHGLLVAGTRMGSSGG
jgi:transcriptional regulator of acetoin/glycerol metabolism